MTSSVVDYDLNDSSVVVGIIHFRMLFKQVSEVIYFVLSDLSSTYWASLHLRELIFYLAPKLVTLLLPLHEPIPIQAQKVESMEALVNSHQIRPI